MPLSPVTKLYATEDAKISKLLTDPSGGSATYDPVIDVPGIKTVGIDFELSSVELRGDNTRLDADSALVGLNLTFEHAKLSLDALAVFLGGAVVDSGVAPNQKKTFSRLGTHAPSYFRFEAKTPTNGADTVGGDVHLVVYKCKLVDYELGFAEEDYQTLSGEFQGVYRTSDNKLFDVVLNETAAAIA